MSRGAMPRRVSPFPVSAQPHHRGRLVLLCAALAVAGCNAVLGIDEPRHRPEESAGSTEPPPQASDDCDPCDSGEDCSTGFCNRVESSDLDDLVSSQSPPFGRCSEPGVVRRCACTTGYLTTGGDWCVGMGCRGTRTTLCDHLSGEELVAGAPAGAGGAASSGGAPGVGAAPPLSGGAPATFPGTGGAGPSASPPAVSCGATECSDPLAGLSPELAEAFRQQSVVPVACCADRAASQCGTMLDSTTCVATPPEDPTCPAVEFLTGFSSMPCCTDFGQCGLSLLGLPCVDLASLSTAGGPTSVPAPRPCGSVAN